MERVSERGKRTSERASFRLDVRCERDCRGWRNEQANEFHTQSNWHTHTHILSHTRYRAVCGSGCCLSCLRALSLPLSFSFSLSHLPGLVIELEPYSSLLDLLFRYLCVCSMRVCVRTCVCVVVCVRIALLRLPTFVLWLSRRMRNILNYVRSP